MTRKKYPLPKKFRASLSERAYAKLRNLSEKYGYGNNYLLTILLENLDDVADPSRLDHAIRTFEREYGGPGKDDPKSKI